MTFDIKLRQELLARYFELVNKCAGEQGDANALAFESELANKTREYEESLPRVPMSRCPLTGEVIVHSFDPYGLDGLWWNCDAPIRPMFERFISCIAITGAVKIGGPIENVPFLCKPGPGAPYVYPKILEKDGVYAVLSSMPVGAHTAYAILYFSQELPEGLDMPNEWGTNAYWDASDGNPGWYESATSPQDWDFDIGYWIERGKLFWIAPFDETLTLKSDVGTCPYLDIKGTHQLQRIAYGKLTLDEDFPPNNTQNQLEEDILKGGFVLHELKPQIREELNLPPLAIPIRAANETAIFTSDGKIDLAKLLDEIRSCIALNPNLSGLYNPYISTLSYIAGITAAEAGNHSAALEIYEYGLEIDHENINLRSHKALSLECLGRANEAKPILESLVADMPRGNIMPFVWVLLARIYASDGQKDEALNLIAEVEKAAPNEAGLQELSQSIKGELKPKPFVSQPQYTQASTPARTNSGIIAFGGVIIGLLIAAVVYLGHDKLNLKSPATIVTNNIGETGAPVNETKSTPEPEKADNTSQLTANLPGVWAPRDYGCAGGFAAGYTAGGRYVEGDEYTREEGHWTISDGKLQRDINLTIQAVEDISEPKIENIQRSDVLDIVSITSSELHLRLNGNDINYIKCPEGHVIFMDGETFK